MPGSQNARRLTIWDAITPVLAVTALLLACAIASGKRPFWYDEIFSWTTVTDPSLSHMLRAIAAAAESPPPFYHLLARVWVAVFGASMLTLRLFSSVGIAVGMLAAWFTLRRAFSMRATAFGLLAVLGTSALVQDQNSEARFYGLFLAMAGLALAAWAKAAERSGASASLLAATFLAHAGLVLCHVYGLAYSGMLLLALLAWDLTQRRFRPRLYAVIAASWLTLLPWLGTFRMVARLAWPRGWIPVPTLNQLLDFYRLQSPYLPLLLIFVAALICLERLMQFGVHRREVLVLVCLAVAASLAWRRGFMTLLDLLLAAALVAALGWDAPAPEDEASRRGHALLFAAAAFLLVPIVAFIYSHVARPVFVIRYILPSALGAAIVLAWVVERGVRARRSPTSSVVSGLGWAALLIALLAWPIVTARSLPATDTPLYGTSRRAVEALAPASLPVVAEDALSFLPLEFENSREAARPLVARQYFFVLDSAPALDPRSSPRAPIAFQGMTIWRQVGYLPGHILPADEFLNANPRFVVLHAPQFLWYELRLKNNPAYNCRVLGRVGDSEVVLVERNN